MQRKPVVTVFGSCRVYTPCTILQARGQIVMNQQNIFGYTHYSSEILQQFELITGRRQIPSRLRPYLNIPENWRQPGLGQVPEFHTLFKDTDVFVVEVSSVRKILFKAFCLQINRVREILVENEKALKAWWNVLVRQGLNRNDILDMSKFTPVQVEVAKGIRSIEQTSQEIMLDLQKIYNFIGRPVVFVSHFDAGYLGESIPQRRLITSTLHSLAAQEPIHFMDPTSLVLGVGVLNSLQDLGHYKPSFEPVVAEQILNFIQTALARSGVREDAALLQET